MDRKMCRNCGEYLGLRSFGKDAEGKFGRRANCKICMGHDVCQNMHDKKVCSGCDNEKKLTNYYPGRSKFGRSNICIDCHNLKRKERYAKNPQKEITKASEWAKNNKDKLKEYARKSIKIPKNRAVRTALEIKRQAAKKLRCPSWLTEDQHDQIKEFYLLAAKLTDETGTRYEVDHIVPLQGKEVSGLHVPWNLQVITKEENMKKRNKLLEAITC